MRRVAPGVLRAACADTNDRGLHNHAGSVDVLPYGGSNPLYQHGDFAPDKFGFTGARVLLSFPILPASGVIRAAVFWTIASERAKFVP